MKTTVVRVNRHRARVTVGQYNTICDIRDIYAVKLAFKEMLANERRCKKCGQVIV